MEVLDCYYSIFVFCSSSDIQERLYEGMDYRQDPAVLKVARLHPQGS
jgi:hypothetical protein